MKHWQKIDVGEESWLVDMSFLLSGYNCIWGKGCEGAHHTKVGHDAGCCGVGVTTDRADRKKVRARVKELKPGEWAYQSKVRRLFTWRQRCIQTRLQKLDNGNRGTCIFYNHEGSGSPHGCALHAAALARGESYIDWKPWACSGVPMWSEFNTDLGMYILKPIESGWEWTELDYWCMEDENAYTNAEPVFKTMAAELEMSVESHQEGAWEAIRTAAEEAWQARVSAGTSTPVRLRTRT